MSDKELARFGTLARVDRGELEIADAVSLLGLWWLKAAFASRLSRKNRYVAWISSRRVEVWITTLRDPLPAGETVILTG